MKRLALALAAGGVALTQVGMAQAQQSSLQSMAASHAAANGVPMSLVHRVIMRESRYNPRAVSRGNYGIMQIRLGTARAMGYTGSAAGLLDPNTNMTYAVKYLAGAYKVAGGNESRAVGLYASGYYYAAKRQGLTRLASYRQPAETNYSLFAPQQPAATYTNTKPHASRRALRQQQLQQQQQASLFGWTAPQPAAATRRGRHARRTATVTAWQNPLGGLFTATTRRQARSERHLRYARDDGYTPSYY
jgi:soluble lytic murein transglycosylase-like protein